MGSVEKITVKRAGAPSEERRRNMDAYIEWLLTPEAERQPQTKRAFAQEMGVTTQTLRNYTRDPHVQHEMQKRGRALNRVERAGDVVDSLYEIATDREQTPSARVSAARVFLDWTDKTVAELSPQDLQDMSFDELHELLDDLERKTLD